MANVSSGLKLRFSKELKLPKFNVVQIGNSFSILKLRAKKIRLSNLFKESFLGFKLLINANNGKTEDSTANCRNSEHKMGLAPESMALLRKS